MNVQVARPASVPRRVRLFSPLAKALLRAGVPLGPNGLLTIRGRTTGLPRTTAVAIIERGGRRFVWSPWGETHWVRNLRAARRGTLTLHRRAEEVTATELGPGERVAFFRDVLGPLARSMRGGVTFVRVVDGVDLDDPEGAARGRVAFELHGPADGAG